MAEDREKFDFEQEVEASGQQTTEQAATAVGTVALQGAVSGAVAGTGAVAGASTAVAAFWPLAALMAAYLAYKGWETVTGSETSFTDEETQVMMNPILSVLPGEIRDVTSGVPIIDLMINLGGFTGKDDSQIRRDRVRAAMKANGFITVERPEGAPHDQWNVTLANGSKYDIGLDGDNMITGVDGKPLRVYNVDTANPLAQQAVGFLNPLMVQITNGNDKLTSDFVGYLSNAALSNATDIEQVRQNAIGFYTQILAPYQRAAAENGQIVSIQELALGAIQTMHDQGTITDAEFQAFTNGVNQTFGSAPLTPPGTPIEEDPSQSIVHEDRPLPKVVTGLENPKFDTMGRPPREDRVETNPATVPRINPTPEVPFSESIQTRELRTTLPPVETIGAQPFASFELEQEHLARTQPQQVQQQELAIPERQLRPDAFGAALGAAVEVGEPPDSIAGFNLGPPPTDISKAPPEGALVPSAPVLPAGSSLGRAPQPAEVPDAILKTEAPADNIQPPPGPITTAEAEQARAAADPMNQFMALQEAAAAEQAALVEEARRRQLAMNLLQSTSPQLQARENRIVADVLGGQQQQPAIDFGGLAGALSEEPLF